MFVQSSEDFEKKRDFSKVWFFVWSYETKTAIFNFDIPAEKFFAKHGNCSFKFLKNWKKKRTFESLVFDWSYETKSAFFNFEFSAENFLAKHSKGSLKVSKCLKKIRTFKKNFFTQIIPLDTLNAVLRNRSKFFRQGSKRVSLQVMSLLIPTSQREFI